ncbi:MAG: hypothetical protein D6706_20050 [Chloroflexi bacterium]|nr:MAG: hypothetical protein D6706_20050 [Chloroflexota bacterium]
MNTPYSIIVRDGVQYVTYKGEVLPLQVKTKVTQDVDYIQGKIAKVQVTVFARLADTVQPEHKTNGHDD